MLPLTSSSSCQQAVLTAQHACRDSGVILLASGGAGLELLQIWGKLTSCFSSLPINYTTCSQSLGHARHWAKGTLGQAYIEKNPLAALQAFAIASGWERSSFMKRHFLGRALVRTTAQEAL